ncbi:MAG TPA: tetratricopeptide repeat protein [Candidatus Limnocylindrales bacterium]|nr:tetratricopeptide repeat protein [Candidatus Limnocylindrales bacterium]
MTERNDGPARPDRGPGGDRSDDWTDYRAGSPDTPDDPRETAYALLQRGKALLHRRHHAQAAIVLERAARLEPGKGSILEALGRAYYNSGQHERSAEVFSRLLEVDPSAPYAHFGLGQSLKRLGRAREARTHLRLAVALAPSSALYRGALARLGPVGDEATEREEG